MSNEVKRGAEVLFGVLMAWGGVMHFTVDQTIWKSSLLNAMANSGFLWREIGIVNLVAGVALITNRWTPLAALVLLPIAINIFLFHAFRKDLFGLTIGVPILVLGIFVAYNHMATYRPLLAGK